MSEREPMLTNEALYFADLRSYPQRISPEERNALEALAREGDEAAKELMLINIFRWISRLVPRLIKSYDVQIDSYLDIVSVGNVAVMEHVDSALATKAEPSAYLCVVARSTMVGYCKRRSSLIPVNSHFPLESKSKERPRVDSLDAQPDFANIAAIDEISAPNALSGMLNEAIDSLGPRQKEAIVRHLGLDGEPTESFHDIDHRRGNKAAQKNYFEGVWRLRKKFKQA